MENFKIPQVNFKVREGDVVLEDGCSFDEGKWVEKTTDDFLKVKELFYFLYQVPLHQLVHQLNYQVLMKTMKKLKV